MRISDMRLTISTTLYTHGDGSLMPNNRRDKESTPSIYDKTGKDTEYIFVCFS